MNNLNRSQISLQLGAVCEAVKCQVFIFYFIYLCVCFKRRSLYHVAVGYPGTLCEPSWPEFIEISPYLYLPRAGIEGICHHSQCFQVRSVYSLQAEVWPSRTALGVFPSPFPSPKLKTSERPTLPSKQCQQGPNDHGSSQAWTGSLNLTCDCSNPTMTRK